MNEQKIEVNNLDETNSQENQNNNAQNNNAFYRSITFMLYIALGFAIIYTYKYPMLRTWDSWGSEHGYNANGMMIFIGSCLLLFWVAKQLKKVPKQISFLGLGFVVASLLFTLAFKRGDINAMQSIGLIALIWSICFYLGGKLLARAVAFPLFLMLFSVQWGLGSSVVSLKMRIVSTKFACWFINFTGKPFDIQVIRQGTNVSMVGMPDLAFDVAAACSGLQSLMMTSVLSLLMCYLMLKTWWKRLIMILLIVPVAILNNSLRIVLIAYFGKFFVWIEHTFHLSEGWGKKVAFGAFHEYPGVVVYGLGFLMVWLIAHYLEKLPGVERELMLKRKAEKEAKKAKEKNEENDEDDDENDEEDDDDEKQETNEPPDYTYYKKLWKHVLVVLLLVLATYFTGKQVKQNIYYTKGLTAIKFPTLVVGKKGYRVENLNRIVAIPSVIGKRAMVETPVSAEELKQLPDDTEYFRGLYVPTNIFTKYSLLANDLLNKNFNSNDYRIAEKQISAYIKNIVPKQRWGTNEINRLTYLTLLFRSNLQRNSDPARKKMAFRHLLASIARIDDNPDAIMLAIVQNNTDRHSIHAPEACFPAQGWQIDEPKPVKLSLGGNEFEVARMDAGFKQKGVRECVLYWYQCEGANGNKVYATRNYPWLPFKTAFDLILKGRSDRWAFIRLSTSMKENESFEDAYKRLTDFVKELEPYITYK